MNKKKEEIRNAIKIIAKQFTENEVYSGKEIKNKLEELYPGAVEFEKKIDKTIKPYKTKR